MHTQFSITITFLFLLESGYKVNIIKCQVSFTVMANLILTNQKLIKQKFKNQIIKFHEYDK